MKNNPARPRLAVDTNLKPLVYEVLTNNGPDVDMWSASFSRLVGQIRKAISGQPTRTEVYNWLKDNGYFGRKSDSLRAEGDKFYG